jgi:hypothetical protein
LDKSTGERSGSNSDDDDEEDEDEAELRHSMDKVRHGQDGYMT